MTEKVNPFIDSGIADVVLEKLKTNSNMMPDIEDCVFSVKEAEDILSKKKVPQVVVEFKNPLFMGMDRQKERITRAFALGPTVLSNGKSLFTPEQQVIARDILKSQKEG
jgi:hypothetical protein